jgi:hypothetical protein
MQATARMASVVSSTPPARRRLIRNVRQKNKNKYMSQKRNMNTALKLGLLCLALPIFLLIYSAAFDVALAHMVVLLPIELIVAWIAWIILLKAFRSSSFWVLSLIPSGLGLVAGWYAASRMIGAAMLWEISKNAEKTLGRSLSKIEYSDLHSQTLNNVEFWMLIAQKSFVSALGGFLMILASLMIMYQRTNIDSR